MNEYPPHYGVKQCNKYFLDYRFDVVCKGMTMNQFLELPDDQHVEWVQKLLKTMKKKNIYRLYFGSVANYRPYNAIEIYRKYKSHEIIDPFAGWGGRAFGALTLGLKYTGFDSNTNLREPYDALIRDYKCSDTITINICNSATVDFSKYKYDTILTSPPFYDREIYPGMPNYISKNDFENTILKPIFTSLWNNLPHKGVMAIHMPVKMYDFFKLLFGECNEKLPYANWRKGTGVFTDYTYVWVHQ